MEWFSLAEITKTDHQHSENYFIRILYAACMIELIMNFATSIA